MWASFHIPNSLCFYPKATPGTWAAMQQPLFLFLGKLLQPTNSISLSISLTLCCTWEWQTERTILAPDFNAFTVLKIVTQGERECRKETTRKCQIPASPTQVLSTIPLLINALHLIIIIKKSNKFKIQLQGQPISLSLSLSLSLEGLNFGPLQPPGYT